MRQNKQRKQGRKKRQIEKLPSRKELLQKQGRVGQRIGSAGERRVMKAFEIPGMPEWVLKPVRRATQVEDARGVDVFLMTDVGEIPIQIKTSVVNDRNTPDKNTRQKIPHVYITLRESDAEVRKKIYRVAALKREEIKQTIDN